ncbi:TRAP transporter small permease [Rhizobium sp. SSA_523]|uniref:TRAP transporter small permease n=1 Tax=Rhizobium sp. SSA_523 TaxID=2952477 RepID=UPI00209049D8|nr:TRAP transporter small permease [Rhizobium sp. SSA_523]MCO5734488.1 TRAP transporter small permease [Rhizobium sp. SSA_523]WKC23263.1 TRAP transporter small permease [Rhizobium sp. SSA_523]
MKTFIRSVRPALGLLSRAALYIAAVGIVAMTLIVGWQVFGRYVLNSSPSWSEPLSLFMMSWFILLGAAVGVRESGHLGLDIVRYAMPKPVQRAMDLISLALVAGFGCCMSYYGVLLARGTWTATIPVLGWPGGVDFIPLIVGGGLIALFAVERLCDVIIDEPEATVSPADSVETV